jgi:hypothetical protein
MQRRVSVRPRADRFASSLRRVGGTGPASGRVIIKHPLTFFMLSVSTTPKRFRLAR